MVRKVCLYLLSIILLGAFSGAEVIAYRNNNIENNAMSARGMAMGGAISAVFNSTDSLLLNPAALVGSEKNTFSAKSESAMADVRRMSLVSVTPFSPQHVLSFGYTSIGVSDIKIAEDNGTDITIKENGSYAESAMFLGYAFKINPNIYLGGTFKHYENKLNVTKEVYEQGSAAGNDLDLGMIYRVDNNLAFSTGFKNIGSAVSKEGAIRWGNGYRESFDFGSFIGVSYAIPDKQLLVAMDVRSSKLFKSLYNIGLEYAVHPSTALRLGYNNLNKISLGLGFNFMDITADYAYLPDFATSADNRHFISVGYSFDSSWGETKNKPQVETKKEVRKPTRRNRN